jgi:hypothetical protein
MTMVNVLVLLASLLMPAANPPDGTVIFVTQSGRQDVLAKKIEQATGDNISHTAIILYEDDQPYVYESTIPGGVQRNKLKDYMKKVNGLKSAFPTKGMQIHLIPPDPEYNADELIRMKHYANGQLGRPYMLRGWWKGKEVRGMHCSQYVGNIVSRSGRIESFNYKESPASLYVKLEAIELVESHQ